MILNLRACFGGHNSAYSMYLATMRPDRLQEALRSATCCGANSFVSSHRYRLPTSRGSIVADNVLYVVRFPAQGRFCLTRMHDAGRPPSATCMRRTQRRTDCGWRIRRAAPQSLLPRTAQIRRKYERGARTPRSARIVSPLLYPT